MAESLSQTARDTCYDKVTNVTTGLRTRDDIMTVGDANSAGREGDFTAVVSGISKHHSRSWIDRID